MAYTFDEIKGQVTLLAKLYSDINAAETAVRDRHPIVSSQVLTILGAMREPLNEDDRLRFDRVLDKLIETNNKARYGDR